MKETKQAKENVYNWKRKTDGEDYLDNCIEHKQTCQRWLEFLENNRWFGNPDWEDKIKDLKQAIKTYEDAGI